MLMRILRGFLALTVLVSSLAIFSQVVLRYGFNRPIGWVDEFAVLVFAWMILIGSVIAQANDEHISMDTFVRLMPEPARRALKMFRYAVVAGVSGVLLWQGLILSRKMVTLEYPGMEISRSFLYGVLPVCMPLMIYYVLRCAWREWTSWQATEAAPADTESRS